MSTVLVARPHSRRGFLSGGAAAIFATGAATSAIASLPAPLDPVFALIDIERGTMDRWLAVEDAAYAAEEASRKAWTNNGKIPVADLTQRERETRDASTAALQEWRSCFRAVMEAKPTTAAGLCAMIARFVEEESGMMIDPDETGLLPLLATVSAFLKRGA